MAFFIKNSTRLEGYNPVSILRHRIKSRKLLEGLDVTYVSRGCSFRSNVIMISNHIMIQIFAGRILAPVRKKL